MKTQTKTELLDNLEKKVDSFILTNEKICWEAGFEGGEYCIGVNKIKQFIKKLLENNL